MSYDTYFPSIPKVCEKLVEETCNETEKECQVVTTTVCSRDTCKGDDSFQARTLEFDRIVEKFGMVCDGSICRSDGNLKYHMATSYELDQFHAGKEPDYNVNAGGFCRGSISERPDVIDTMIKGVRYMASNGIPLQKLEPTLNFLEECYKLMDKSPFK
jgi:hypothetical protein